jgi:hypothetical protein
MSFKPVAFKSSAAVFSCLKATGINYWEKVLKTVKIYRAGMKTTNQKLHFRIESNSFYRENSFKKRQKNKDSI